MNHIEKLLIECLRCRRKLKESHLSAEQLSSGRILLEEILESAEIDIPDDSKERVLNFFYPFGV